MVVLATHRPPTMVLPAPQPRRTCVIMPSGWGIGAGSIACAEVATAKAKPATAINLTILLLPFFTVGLFNPAVVGSERRGVLRTSLLQRGGRGNVFDNSNLASPRVKSGTRLHSMLVTFPSHP